MSDFNQPNKNVGPPAPMDLPVEPIDDSVVNDWVVLLAQFGLLAAFALFAADAWPLPLFCMIGIGIGLLIIAAAAATLARSFRVQARPSESGLKTAGIYSFVRNPMYLGLIIIAASICAGSKPFSWLMFVFFVTVLLSKIRSEEGYLSAAYPEYSDYLKRTKRLIPFLW